MKPKKAVNSKGFKPPKHIIEFNKNLKLWKLQSEDVINELNRKRGFNFQKEPLTDMTKHTDLKFVDEKKQIVIRLSCFPQRVWKHLYNYILGMEANGWTYRVFHYEEFTLERYSKWRRKLR
jgi:hypothetical protein